MHHLGNLTQDLRGRADLHRSKVGRNHLRHRPRPAAIINAAYKDFERVTHSKTSVWNHFDLIIPRLPHGCNILR
jgi:hypothetical protein